MDNRLEQVGHDRRGAARRSSLVVPRPAARWGGLAAGLSSMALAHALASTGTPPHVVVALCVLAVVAVAGAAMALFVWAGADTTRVFRSRSLAMVTAAMAVVAGCTIVHIARSSPFSQLAATGRFSASDIADLGCVVVAVSALVGLVVGVAESGSACRRERRWSEQMAASR